MLCSGDIVINVRSGDIVSHINMCLCILGKCVA